MLRTVAAYLIGLAVLLPGTAGIAQDQVIAGKPIITDAAVLN